MHQINMKDKDNSARNSFKTKDSSPILNFYKLRLEWNVTITWNRNGPILIHNSNNTDGKWQCCVVKLDFYLSVSIRLFHRHRSKLNPTKLSLNSYDSLTTLNVYRPRRYSLQTLQPMLRFKINGCINVEYKTDQKIYEYLIKNYNYYYVKTCKSVSARICFKSPTVFY